MLKLYLSNNSNETVFVWNPQDIYKLRKCYRIVGTLIGVHPYKANQVKRHHVPLKLNSQEVKLLLNKGIAQLFSSPSEPPNETVIKKMYEKRSQLCDEQIVLNKEHRKQEILMKCKDPNIAVVKSEQVKEISKDDTYFQIFTECPWRKNIETEAEFKYPSTPEDKVKYAVFKDLWEKKFYITSGSKFGGDYLVYAGDPIICHSLYVVVCVPPSRKIQGFDIIVYGRLGKQVKKTVVLASLNEKREVEYISLQYVPDKPRGFNNE